MPESFDGTIFGVFSELTRKVNTLFATSITSTRMLATDPPGGLSISFGKDFQFTDLKEREIPVSAKTFCTILVALQILPYF